MFNGIFQPTHLILILVVVLILFGPGKLPEAGKALGRTMRDMRNAFSGQDEENMKEQTPVEKNSGTEKIAATTAAATAAAGDVAGKPVN